jgi:hypothetical protein
MRTPSFPKELKNWLDSLPENDRMRETMIATRNIVRIMNHLNKNHLVKSVGK